MKKLLLLIVSCLFVSLNMQAQNVTGVELSLPDTIILPVTEPSQDTTLVAHVMPFDATNKNVDWHVIEESSASLLITTSIVDDTILKITPLGAGTVKIVVETKEANATGTTFKDTCVIRIVVPAEGIILSDTEGTTLSDTIWTTIDGVDTLRARLITSLSPPNAVSEDSVIWENLNENLVRVEVNGLECIVTALAKDTAKIIVKTYDYDDAGTLFAEYKDSCVIVIDTLVINDLSLRPDTMRLFVGVDTVLIATFDPPTGIDRFLYWGCTNFSCVDTISSNNDTICRIIALAPDTAKVIATSRQSPSKKDTCVVIVRNRPAEEMSLNYDTLNLDRDSTYSELLIATVSPFNTTNKAIEWTSEDPTIVEIVSPAATDTICEFRTLRSGTAKIYARALDGDGDSEDLKDSCVVNVFVPVDSVVFQIDDISISDSIDMYVLDTIRLKATIYPDTATIKSVTWSISAPSIIDTTFVLRDTICDITGLKKGEAIIYAIVNDRDSIHMDSCVFTVDYKPITGVNLYMPDSVNIFRFEEDTLTVTVEPFLATNDSVIWTSSDSTTVDIINTEDTICYIKALKLGEATIYVTSKIDPAKQDSCVYTVLPIHITEVILPDSIDLYLNNQTKLTANLLPLNVTEKELVWESSNRAVVDIISSGYDTICEISGKGIGVAKIYATALDGITKDSCVVTVREQLIFLESDTVNVNGDIELFVVLPTGVPFTGSFELQLPKGFGLTYGEVSNYRASLTNAYKGLLDLTISRVNDSTYTFNMQPKATTSSSVHLRSGTKTKVMDIVYTIYEKSLKDSKENYIARIVDVIFDLDNDDPKIEEKKVEVVIKSFEDPTGNVAIFNPANSSYIKDNRLYVSSDKSETISVYSLTGSLLFTGNKKEGTAVFNLKTPETILIVRGSSGWVNKVINR